MAIVNININKRIASVNAGVELVCNNPRDTIRFSFDDEWDAHLTKTARFSWEGQYIDVPFTGNIVKTPEIYRTNYVFIGVYTDSITSTPVKVPCRYSIKCMGGKVVPPTDDVYNQIIKLLNATMDSDVHAAIAALENYEPRPFEASGNPVKINNFEGMPMNVLTTLEPVQAGSGNPSPDNVRAISGWIGTEMICNTQEYSLEFGETIYGGTLNWNTGILTVEWAKTMLDGSANDYISSYNASSLASAPGYSYIINLNKAMDTRNAVIKSDKRTQAALNINDAASDVEVRTKDVFMVREASTPGSGISRLYMFSDLGTIEEFKAALASDPITLAFQLKKPYTIAFSAHEINALSGTNTVSGDGTLTVSGRTDILWLTSNLLKRIVDLEHKIYD